MDTSSPAPLANGHTDDQNKEKVNEKMDCKEDEKPKENGHSGSDNKMSSPSSSTEENIPKRTTGTNNYLKQPRSECFTGYIILNFVLFI